MFQCCVCWCVGDGANLLFTFRLQIMPLGNTVVGLSNSKTHQHTKQTGILYNLLKNENAFVCTGDAGK